MKKNLIFTVLFLIATYGFSQVTINSNNVIGINEPVMQSVDSLPPAIDLLGAGNQTWDFTILQEHSVDTIVFSDPAGSPYVGDFPTANMMINDGTVYGYANKSDSEFVFLGAEGDMLGNGHVYTIRYLPSGRKEIFFPMTYLDSDSSYHYYDITIDANDVGLGALGDSIIMKSEEFTTRSVDAYGQVSIPNAAFDCIRENKRVIKIDTTWLHNQFLGWQVFNNTLDTTYTYSWYSDDPLTKVDVASVDYDPSTNQPIDSIDFKYLKFNPNSVQIPMGKGVGIFPNPASDYTFVYGLNSGALIQVLDITGKVIKKQLVTSGKEKIDLTGLKNGIYFLKTISGKKVYLQKLIKR